MEFETLEQYSSWLLPILNQVNLRWILSGQFHHLLRRIFLHLDGTSLRCAELVGLKFNIPQSSGLGSFWSNNKMLDSCRGVNAGKWKWYFGWRFARDGGCSCLQRSGRTPRAGRFNFSGISLCVPFSKDTWKTSDICTTADIYNNTTYPPAPSIFLW